MGFWAILLLSVGLAMDAAAVAATRGFITPRLRARHVMLVAGLFGGFQAFMPLLGWLLGSRFGPLVAAWDHWIAFIVLSTIGGKMLWDASGLAGPETDRSTTDPFELRLMLGLALATSIDAFAVGITLPLMGAPLLLSLVTIGATTALLSALGLFAGRHFGQRLGRRLELVGGLLVIGLGTRILVQHLQGP